MRVCLLALVLTACTAPVDTLGPAAHDLAFETLTSAAPLQLKASAVQASGAVLFVVRHQAGLKLGDQRVAAGVGTSMFRYEDGVAALDEVLEQDLEVVRAVWGDEPVVSAGYLRQTSVLGEALFSAGGFDSFVARLDSGVVTRIASPGDTFVNGLATDALGGVYIAGRFQQGIDIEGRALVGVAGDDAFVARLEPDGRVDWILALATTGRDAISGLAVTPTQGVFVTGTLGGPLDLGTFALDGPNPYLLEIDPFGRPIRGRVFRGDADLSVLAVDERTHALWMAGTFRGDLELEATFRAVGQTDVVVARVNRDFSIEAVRYGGPQVDVVESGAVDRYGRFWLIGTLRGMQLLAPGTPPDDDLDAFFAAFRAPSEVVDRRRIAGLGAQVGSGIGVDSGGSVRITGETAGPFEVPGAGEIPSDPGIFLGVLDP